LFVEESAEIIQTLYDFTCLLRALLVKETGDFVDEIIVDKVLELLCLYLLEIFRTSEIHASSNLLVHAVKEEET
jgi:hypothetical protein